MGGKQARVEVGPLLFEIRRLGPLSNTRIELAPLTLLTGPPGQGKTYILSALFSELLPADPTLVGACFFRGRWGDKLKAAQALFEEKIIHVIIDDLIVNRERGILSIGLFGICIDMGRAQRKVERCLEGWLYPRGSRFRLKTGDKYKLLTRIVRLAKVVLERSGFTLRQVKGRDHVACLTVEGVELPLRGLESIPEGRLVLSLAKTLSDMGPEEREYASWMFAASLVSERVSVMSKELSRVRKALKNLDNEVQTVRRTFASYRPVYAWIGRGLVALVATEPGLGELVEMETTTGLGLGAYIPVYSLVRAIREGLRALDPEPTRELALLLDLAAPSIIYRVRKARDRLYLEVDGKAVPFRLAHGSAVSLVGLILAAAPLLGSGGFLLVDEVEHLLHPTAQAIASIVLLAMAGAGVRVIATTHSTAIAAVIARLAKVASSGSTGEVVNEIRRLYKTLGYRPPSREALELAARGATRGARVYLIDEGGAALVENPDEWLPRLSDTWMQLASWASGGGDAGED